MYQVMCQDIVADGSKDLVLDLLAVRVFIYLFILNYKISRRSSGQICFESEWWSRANIECA